MRNRLEYYSDTSDITRFVNRGGKDRKFKKTKYGYIYNWATHYVTLFNAKIYVMYDWRIKVKIRVRKNYRPTYHMTYYFDNEGKEIIAETTRQELALWKK